MFAVRDGFEPPRCDSVSNTLPAGWWSTPYYLPISYSSTPRQEALSAKL